jgi:hypothetical protein
MQDFTCSQQCYCRFNSFGVFSLVLSCYWHVEDCSVIFSVKRTKRGGTFDTDDAL